MRPSRFWERSSGPAHSSSAPGQPADTFRPSLARHVRGSSRRSPLRGGRRRGAYRERGAVPSTRRAIQHRRLTPSLAKRRRPPPLRNPLPRRNPPPLRNPLPLKSPRPRRNPPPLKSPLPLKSPRPQVRPDPKGTFPERDTDRPRLTPSASRPHRRARPRPSPSPRLPPHPFQTSSRPPRREPANP